MDLEGKIVVVTGGSGLLGSEFCRAIVKNNGVAVIGDTNEENGNKLYRKLTEKFGQDLALYFYMDIKDEASIHSLIENVHKKFGRIDALVNSAYPRNKNYGRQFFEVTYADFCENLNLNLGGYFLTSKLFSEYFVRQGWGNIINIASVYGIIPPKFEIYQGTGMTMPVEYAVIKSGLIHFTRFLAKYLKGKNIRVNSLSPGGIIDKQPENFRNNYNKECLNKGMLEPQDIIGALIFLLSDLSSCINGQNIIIDDGFTL